MRVLGIALAVVFLLLVAFLMVATHKSDSPEGRQKAADREAIARCVQARDDELSELATRRLMREQCIHMDAEFERKWGIPSREL